MPSSPAKSLGLKELIAIAVGGMVGGGIFTILGISVSMVGFLAPFAIALGGVVALFAAYSYVKLGVYYRDEGATYAFFKRTYPESHMAASFIGWYTIFGYISTLALYAYTFSSYGISGTEWAHNDWIRKGVAIAIIWTFAAINLWSVRGMGRIEDVMVYVKLTILFVISLMLIYYGQTDLHTFGQTLVHDFANTPSIHILTVASVTFVAYEGFQLVINAVNEMDHPERNIPRAIYSAVILVAAIYFIIALGSILAIPAADLIHNKEYALAAGAQDIMGNFGRDLVIIGAVLATSSAISGTMFGSSRQMARIADDGYLPATLSHRKGTIPDRAILAMAPGNGGHRFDPHPRRRPALDPRVREHHLPARLPPDGRGQFQNPPRHRLLHPGDADGHYRSGRRIDPDPELRVPDQTAANALHRHPLCPPDTWRVGIQPPGRVCGKREKIVTARNAFVFAPNILHKYPISAPVHPVKPSWPSALRSVARSGRLRSLRGPRRAPRLRRGCHRSSPGCGLRRISRRAGR